MNEVKYNLKLVAMSDLALSTDDSEEIDQAIEDINALKPDVVMILGDFGDVRRGYDYILQKVKSLNGVLLPAIGEGDLQIETCETVDDNISLFVNAFGVTHHYYAHEYAGVLFVALSAERRCGGVFLSNAQLSWLRSVLENHPTTPTIVQCHAPVFGTRIPIMPGLQTHKTDFYVNHNHGPEKLLELIAQYPQLIFWFSGHTCLGQSYSDAVCFHSGVYFVHVGAHSSQSTRDGSRHSRVVEIQPNRVCLRTFDHKQRRIDPRYDYELKEGPYGLMCSWEVSTRSGFLSGRLSGFHVNDKGLSLRLLPTVGYLSGVEPIAPGPQAICPTAEKIYLATQGGNVWEYDRQSGLPLGAIDSERRPTCVAAGETHVWVGGDGYIRKVSMDQPERFLRENPADVHSADVPIKGTVRTMHFREGRLLVGVDRRLYEVSPQANAPLPKAVFRNPILTVQSCKDRFYALTENAEIGVFSFPDLQPLQTLKAPSHRNSSHHAHVDFIHFNDRFCLLASRLYGRITKHSLNDMKLLDQFSVNRKLQAVLFDGEEIWILTEAGRLLCVDAGGMTAKAQRELEMTAAAAMAMDSRFIYVATANPAHTQQEVQVIERRTDMVGELMYHVRTANKIDPQLEMDMEVTSRHFFIPRLHAKVYNDWVDLKDGALPSQEFKIRVVLGNGDAARPPSISRIKLKDRET